MLCGSAQNKEQVSGHLARDDPGNGYADRGSALLGPDLGGRFDRQAMGTRYSPMRARYSHRDHVLVTVGLSRDSQRRCSGRVQDFTGEDRDRQVGAHGGPFPLLRGRAGKPRAYVSQSLTSDRGLLFVIFVTLANATGDPPARFIGPTNDRDAAATLLADDLLLRTSARVNLHPARADLNGGLSKTRRAAQQPQRDQDGILHHIFLHAPAW